MSYVLLIEDNQATADMIIRTLDTAGYDCKHFIRGLDGARQARQLVPAIILMDFDLPDIDGRALSMVLKRQFGITAPPIIAVTARTGRNEEYISRRMGCDAYIAKPFLPEDLLALIAHIVGNGEKSPVVQ